MTEQTEKASADVSTVLSVDRTRLAYDPTMLSWISTATSLITFGFSIEQFFRIAKTGIPASADLFGPQEFGMVMISGGLVALLLATLENRSAIKSLTAQYPAKEGYPETPPRGHQRWRHSSRYLDCWPSSRCWSGVERLARGAFGNENGSV